MLLEYGRDTYVITRESLTFQDDLVLALGIRVIEGRHQKVQVCRQRLHHRDLRFIRPHDRGHKFGRTSIGIEPCRQRRVVQRLEVSLDALSTPSVQILLNACCCLLWPQAERIPADVDARFQVPDIIGRVGFYRSKSLAFKVQANLSTSLTPF